MTTLREAAQQALEALETRGEHHPRVYTAITALKAALAEPVQEPVQEHEDWCASVTQLLLCDPPRKAPCNCKKKVAEPKFDCLKCGAEIYDGRNFPPSPYLCKKCLEEPVAHSIGDSNG